MVPAQVRELRPVGAHRGRGKEVVARGDDRRLGRAVRGQRDELVDDLVLVPLADADDRPVHDDPVRVAQRARLRRLGRDRARLGPDLVDEVDALVVEVREEDRRAVEPVGAAAVLVDAVANVEACRNDVLRLSLPGLEDEHRAALVRPRLEPVHAVLGRFWTIEATPRRTGGGDEVRGDRGRPGSVRGFRHAVGYADARPRCRRRRPGRRPRPRGDCRPPDVGAAGRARSSTPATRSSAATSVGSVRRRCPPGRISNLADVRELLAHLGVERATLVGGSLGARVALEYALTYPDSVDALVLMGPGLRDMKPDRGSCASRGRRRTRWSRRATSTARSRSTCGCWVDGAVADAG